MLNELICIVNRCKIFFFSRLPSVVAAFLVSSPSTQKFTFTSSLEALRPGCACANTDCIHLTSTQTCILQVEAAHSSLLNTSCWEEGGDLVVRGATETWETWSSLLFWHNFSKIRNIFVVCLVSLLLSDLGDIQTPKHLMSGSVIFTFLPFTWDLYFSPWGW